MVRRPFYTWGCVSGFDIFCCKKKEKCIIAIHIKHNILGCYKYYRLYSMCQVCLSRWWSEPLQNGVYLENHLPLSDHHISNCMLSGASVWFMPGSWNYQDTSHAAGLASVTLERSMTLKAVYQMRRRTLCAHTNQISCCLLLIVYGSVVT